MNCDHDDPVQSVLYAGMVFRVYFVPPPCWFGVVRHHEKLAELLAPSYGAFSAHRTRCCSLTAPTTTERARWKLSIVHEGGLAPIRTADDARKRWRAERCARNARRSDENATCYKKNTRSRRAQARRRERAINEHEVSGGVGTVEQ